jgi:Spy/CpxP family protein refolding chaperone
MKKLLSLLVAAVFALTLSLATFAEDKPADKPAAAEGKKKTKKKHDKKKEGEATKEEAGQPKK